MTEAYPIARPYLLFLGAVKDPADAKTAFGLSHWAGERCLAQIRTTDDSVSVGLTEMSIRDAAAAGAKTLVIGVAPDGGAIAPEWIPHLIDALQSGLDVASGLHDRLIDIPELVKAAKVSDRRLIDVRHPRQRFSPGTGAPRDGLRLLTVGTDCAVGKKYAALAIHHGLRARGRDSNFRATGQTGILISGEGVCIDAVVADFISGASEALSPSNVPDHWDIIEGQGSLFHPSYAGVSLGLLHGSQPDAVVICHDPGRVYISGLKQFRVPTIGDCITATVAAAKLTNPRARAVGISLNTSSYSVGHALEMLKNVETETGLPCIDPLRFGAQAVVDLLIREFP